MLQVMTVKFFNQGACDHRIGGPGIEDDRIAIIHQIDCGCANGPLGIVVDEYLGLVQRLFRYVRWDGDGCAAVVHANQSLLG